MDKRTKKNKILFAAVDIGWRINHYKEFLESQYGSAVYIKSFIKHKVSKQQYQTNYDFEYQYINYPKLIQWLISFCFFCYALLKFKTFYFFSGETILTRKSRQFEFSIYRLFKKKIIMHFVGSDIRDYHYLYSKSENLKAFLKNEFVHQDISSEWQKELVKESLNYAHTILVSTPDLLSIVKSATYYPVVVDVLSFQRELSEITNQEQNKHFTSNKIKILHAPSNPKAKGSLFIDQIVKELLEENNNFEYINTQTLNRNTNSLYTVSRYELFQLYKTANIVIDQMVIGWYGVQAIESILANNLVVSYVDEKLKKYLYPNCPIETCDIFELKDKLSQAINKIERDQVDYQAQIEWVKKYHDIKSNHDPLIRALTLTPYYQSTRINNDLH